MKRTLLMLFFILTLFLSGCNAKETNPVDNLEYKLYDFEGNYVYDVLDISGDIDYYDYIYISGIFDKEGVPTLMSFGYDTERDEYRALGEKECNECTYVKLIDDDGFTPWIIYDTSEEYYFEYVIKFGGNEALLYNDYSYEELLSDYIGSEYDFSDVLGDYDSVNEFIEDNPTSDSQSFKSEDYSYTIDENGYFDIESD